jgi:hypothetical protein
MAVGKARPAIPGHAEVSSDEMVQLLAPDGKRREHPDFPLDLDGQQTGRPGAPVVVRVKTGMTGVKLPVPHRHRDGRVRGGTRRGRASRGRRRAAGDGSRRWTGQCRGCSHRNGGRPPPQWYSYRRPPDPSTIRLPFTRTCA